MRVGKLKVVEIRSELEARGLDISGTRPILVKRLRKALDQEQAREQEQRQGQHQEQAHRQHYEQSNQRHYEQANQQHYEQEDQHYQEQAHQRYQEQAHQQYREQEHQQHREQAHQRHQPLRPATISPAMHDTKDNRTSSNPPPHAPLHTYTPSHPPSAPSHRYTVSPDNPPVPQQITPHVPASVRSTTVDDPARTIDVVDNPDPAISVSPASPRPPTGNLGRLKDLALEERLRKRRERFGLVEPVQRPVVPRPEGGAVAEDLRKRRERFGVVERQPRPVAPSADVKVVTEDERNTEELKRRRALKFGGSAADMTLSEEERQRRLKRLRRFQSTSNATAV